MSKNSGYFDTNPYRGSSCPSCEGKRNSFGRCGTEGCEKNYVKASCKGCGRDKMQSYHKKDTAFPRPDLDIRGCRECGTKEVSYK